MIKTFDDFMKDNKNTTGIQSFDNYLKKNNLKVVAIQDTDTTSVSTYKRRFDYQKEQLNNIQKELTLAKGNVVNKNLLNQGIDTSKLGFGVSRKNNDLLKNNYTTMEDTSKKIMNEYQNAEKNSEIKELRQKRKEQESKTGYAEYDYNKKRVAEDEVTLFDKTLGRGINAVRDLVDTVNDPYVTYDENGNRTYLDTYSQMKEQKVSENYDSKIGKFLGDAFYQVSKIGASTAGNLVAPGAGTALYWGNMYRNNLESAKKEGHGTGESMLYATAGTLLEFATGKVLGSATKSLTGGKTNEYNKALKGAVSKLIKNQTIQNFLANAGSEATEEFIQEFADRFLKNTILGEDNKVLSVETLKDALYSAGIGAVSGGILGGKIETENVLNSENDLNNKSGVKNKPNVDQIVKPSTNTKSNENIAHTSSNVVQNLNKQEENVTERLEKIKQLQEVAKQNKKYDKINEVLEEYRNIQEKQNETIKNIENNQNNLIEQINSETQQPKYDLTIDEQNELRALKETDLAIGLDEKESTRLNYLEKKQNGLIKYPDLIGKNSYENIKSNYWNYKNSLDSYNPALYNKIKEVTPSYRNTGRMTKNEWLGLAKNIGNNFKGDSQSLEKYAVQTWFYASPQNNLNRQGKKFVKFDIGEWLTSFYEGAGVGTEINMPTKANTNAQVNYSMPNLPMSSYNYVESNNTKINELRKSANQYLNSSEKTIRTIDLMEKIIADKDYRIRFNPNITNESGVPVNGLITKENGQVTIELNPNANNYVEFLIVHEITHDIATKEMKELILDYAKQDSKFEKSLETLKERYQTDDVSDEVVADVCGELFGNREFIQSVVEKKPNIFMKILNNIRELAKKIKGSKAEEYVSFVEKLKTMWEDAYYSNESKLSESKFSIQQDSNGNNYVEVDTDQDIFDGIDEKDYNKIAKMYITDYLMGNTKLGNSDKVEINKKTSKKYTNPGKKQENFVEKMKLTPELKNVLEIATLRENSSANKINSKFANWEYYDFEFKLNGKTFKGNINIGITDKGKYLYEINNVKKTSGITGTSLHRPTGFSANNIPHSNNNVNSNTSSTTKYSMPISENNAQELDNSSFSFDNKGRKLTKAQQEYFKNSVVKDEKGNLKVVYHGTPFDFNKFSYDFVGANGTALGKGFYLTDSLSMAKGFSKEGKEPMQLYVNITNPMSLNEKTISKQQFKEYVKAVAKADEYYLYDYIDVDLVGFSNAINAAVDGQYEYSDNDVDLIHGVLNTSTLNWEEGFRILNKVLGYDGVIKHYDNGIDAAEGSSDVYVALFPEQIKNVDNTSPTSNEDIRYSQSTDEWNNYLKENFPSAGTKTKMSDINLPTREDIQNSSKKSKVLNPNEISKLTKQDANTTPNLLNYKKNKYNDGKSKFAKNVENKVNMLNEEQKNSILSEDDVKFYDKVTNKESLEKAFKKLEKNGASETLEWFNKDPKNANSIDVAEGWILLKQYADNNDTLGMKNVAKKLRNIGTAAGQTVQAFNIMERMTPEGMVAYAQSELDEAYDKMVKNKTREWINKHRSEFDLTPEETQTIMNIMDEVKNMEDGYEKRVKLAEIQKLMTDKLPPERGAGIKAWMRISMLFNPKTQVRNILGNAVIAPTNAFSDLFASGVDKMISKKTNVRTTGTPNLKSYGKGFKTGLYQSYNDFKKGINTRNIEGNRFEITQGKSFNDKNVIGKNLNRVDNLLSFMLDAGDRGFYEASFTNSINNQMILNKTNKITQEMIDIATSEALSRTWQDNNNYTRFVLQTRNALNKINVKGYGLGDILIPFAKTPANLTKAIVDYSPLGLINAINSGINLKKSLENGQFTPQMQHEFVQRLGKATAGTMLYLIGLALAKAGITSGESDDDKDTKNFMKNTLGINSYSIKIGGKTFTYDWAQPIAAPLSITANIEKNRKENVSTLENILSSLDTAGNILLEQSFMDSINTVLSNNDGIVTGMQEAILELPSRAIPTFSKQIVDLTDSTQRQTFEYNAPLKTSVNKIKSKIPGLSKQLAPSVDTMGRDIQKYGGKNNVFNVFLNPANVNSENLSESASEIYRLYKETGDTTLMPRVSPYYINKNGEKTILTSEQRADYQKTSGKIIEDNVKKLLKNRTYNSLSDEEKADVINNIVNYSYNIAQKETLDFDISNAYYKAYQYSKLGNVSDYYIIKSQEFTSSKDKNGKTISGSKKGKVINYINSMNIPVSQKAILINLNGYKLTNYNSQVINYVNSSNNTTADKKEILKSLGFEVYTKNGKTYAK
jgi:hypothetical protein